LWGYSLKFRPKKNGLINMVGTSNQWVPEIPIDKRGKRWDFGFPRFFQVCFFCASES
jgi:hypothetical protein